MAPRVGEHSLAILEEFGLSSRDIENMKESGAIGTEG